MKELLEAHLKGLEESEAFYTRLICESSLLPESARNTLTGIQSAISFHLLNCTSTNGNFSNKENAFRLLLNVTAFTLPDQHGAAFYAKDHSAPGTAGGWLSI